MSINLIKQALEEDLGKGDITSLLTVEEDRIGQFQLIAKEDFILCGKEYFINSFKYLNEDIQISFAKNDGDKIEAKEIIAEGKGNLRDILSAERTALNFLQFMSGIASQTHKYVKEIEGLGCKILDTRKTIPGTREISKYAVSIGGAKNHRMRLDDQILIKDNHIEAACGIQNALKKTENSELKTEIECETLEQIEEALKHNPDIIMLDNMSPEKVKEAVKLINKKSLTEASGNINIENIKNYAATGVDYISIGSLTHSVKAVDISLKIN